MSEAVHMNSSSSGTAVSVSILCAPLRGMYPPCSFFFLFLFSSYPYRKWANSSPCRIPSTSLGPLGCRATLHYLPTSIFSSRSVPLGTCPLSLWLSAVLFLEKPHQLQGFVISCRGPRVLGCVIGSVVLYASSLRPFPHCLV